MCKYRASYASFCISILHESTIVHFVLFIIYSHPLIYTVAGPFSVLVMWQDHKGSKDTRGGSKERKNQLLSF